MARRGRMRTATSAIAAVLLVFAVMIVIKVSEGAPDTAATPAPSGSAAATVVSGATSVPAATLNTVGRGASPTLPKAITGQPALADGGKPLVVYIGAEYCPFCAAQRWPVVIALSRFGTFQGLGVSHSATDDSFPDTPTLSFHGATYTSQYLAFQGVETTTNTKKNGTYEPLDKLTDQQAALIKQYNAPPYVSSDSAGAIPFMDFANQAVMAGASYSPQLLAGKTHDQVVSAIADPQSQLGRTVDGNANAMTALLCKLTGGQPGDVCTSAAVTAFQGEFADVSAK